MGSGLASYLEPHVSVASTEVTIGGRDAKQTILYQKNPPNPQTLLYFPPPIQDFLIFPYSLMQSQGNHCRSSDLSQLFMWALARRFLQQRKEKL